MSTKNRFVGTLVLAAVAAGGMSACGLKEKIDSAAGASVGTTKSDLLGKVDALESASTEVAEKIGEANPEVVRVVVSDDLLTVTATDPKAREELNEWSVMGGKVLPPTPVDYDRNVKGLRQSVFRYDSVDAQTVNRFAKAALKRSKIKAAHVESVVIDRATDEQRTVQLTAFVKGERDDSTVTGDLHGAVTAVND